MTQVENNINKVIDVVNQLPPMPDNIIRLRKLCADPNVRFKDFIPLIEDDPGLCADILHMANSAYFGVGHTVESIGEAVRYFGMDHLVDFISLSFSEKVIRENFSGIKDLNQYFKHSKIISASARILSKIAGKNAINQEFYSVAGLLHDIGRLVIIIVGGDNSSQFVGSDWMFIEDQIKKEEILLGLDHTIVGEKICNKWEFSSILQEAVRRHHVPLDDKFYEQAAFIFMAHFISMNDFPIEIVTEILPEENLSAIGLTKEKIIIARDQINEHLETIGISS